jgi:mRNA interferase MazF
VRRGDVWLAEVGGKRRPVLVLTRTAVLDVRLLVTVAEVTTSARGLSAEVALDHVAVGLDRESVVNCDGVHTIAQSRLTSHLGEVDDDTMARVCLALGYALGC